MNIIIRKWMGTGLKAKAICIQQIYISALFSNADVSEYGRVQRQKALNFCGNIHRLM